MLVLIWTGDPTAGQEKVKLDRNVGGLEPLIEGMPTVFVIVGMAYYKEGVKKSNNFTLFFNHKYSLDLFDLFMKVKVTPNCQTPDIPKSRLGMSKIPGNSLGIGKQSK